MIKTEYLNHWLEVLGGCNWGSQPWLLSSPFCVVLGGSFLVACQWKPLVCLDSCCILIGPGVCSWCANSWKLLPVPAQSFCPISRNCFQCVLLKVDPKSSPAVNRPLLLVCNFINKQYKYNNLPWKYIQYVHSCSVCLVCSHRFIRQLSFQKGPLFLCRSCRFLWKCLFVVKLSLWWVWFFWHMRIVCHWWRDWWSLLGCLHLEVVLVVVA